MRQVGEPQQATPGWAASKRVARIAFLALIAVGLVQFLILRAGLTWATLARSIADFPAWAFLCVFGLTVANLAFGTLKWLLAGRALAPDITRRTRFVEAMLTTSFGALLGQIMPFQVGVGLARWVAGKIGVGPSARLNLGATIYEQLFDAMVLLAASVVSILGLAFHSGPVGWALLILCCGLSVTVSGSALISPILTAVARCVAYLPSHRIPKFILEFEAALHKTARLSPSVLRQLAILSILRYAAIVAWVAAVLGGLEMRNFILPAVIGVPLITLIGLIPLTPGNLGVMEWTWSAILVSAGATLGSAGLFALMVRVINIVALVALITSLFVALLLQRLSMIWRWREE